MPSEDQKSKSDSNLKIIALVAVFLLVALLAVLFYYQNNSSNKISSDSAETKDESQWFTYTSNTHNYSISYPKDWTKVEASKATTSTGLEIVLLNLTDSESRDNGKPNIIITAGAPDGYCDSVEDCKALGGNVYAQYKANGDQALIDEVLATFKTN